jgi:hypothetical protein
MRRIQTALQQSVQAYKNSGQNEEDNYKVRLHVKRICEAFVDVYVEIYGKTENEANELWSDAVSESKNSTKNQGRPWCNILAYIQSNMSDDKTLEYDKKSFHAHIIAYVKKLALGDDMRNFIVFRDETHNECDDDTVMEEVNKVKQRCEQESANNLSDFLFKEVRTLQEESVLQLMPKKKKRITPS